MQRIMAYFGLVGALAGVALALAIHLAIFFAAFVLLREGVLFLGIPPTAMGGQDQLFGWVFRFLDAAEVTAVDVLAGAFALATAVLSLFAYRTLSRMRALYLARRECVRQGLDIGVQRATDNLGSAGADLLLGWVPLLALVLAFDYSLFHLRGVMEFLAINPSNAVQAPGAWEALHESSMGRIFDNLFRLGSWAYIAMEFGACMVLEKSLAHFLERGAVLTAALSEPALGAALPGNAPVNTVAYPRIGPLSQSRSGQSGSPGQANVEVLPSLDISGAGTGRASTGVPSEGDGGGAPNSPVTTDASVATGADIPVEIIGSPGQKVTIADAQHDPQYMVDRETGTVWLRAYREAVLGSARSA
jgi:hypothetical protein